MYMICILVLLSLVLASIWRSGTCPYTGDRMQIDEDAEVLFFQDNTKASFHHIHTLLDTLRDANLPPLEIENMLLVHPDKFITDVTVSGVISRQTTDECHLACVDCVVSYRGSATGKCVEASVGGGVRKGGIGATYIA
ncbi:hypothetical protein K503DRAFT_784324 [Rhizopogon vinicolor AM-OR11-026]|uniref:Uncharacterized protein n=1 Tax=Rhizopogon vinicolor AM-OR11-026 TaxID=1314800 RepID=A0A1B7MV65_9AGAM|nr:hypothetical protein K503DRAFT_784324 [Rhizopogon vinicolor AM-OR11-026]